MTKAGYAFIARYMGKGTLTVGNKSYSFKSSGDRAKDVLYIQSTSSSVMEDRNGTTRTFVKGFGKELNQVTTKDNITQGVSEVIDLKVGLSEKKATNTLGHEAFVHADKDANRLNTIDKKMANGDYNVNTSEYINDAIDVSTSGQQDHKDLGNGEVPKYENYSKELSNQKKDPYYYDEYVRDADRFK